MPHVAFYAAEGRAVVSGEFAVWGADMSADRARRLAEVLGWPYREEVLPDRLIEIKCLGISWQILQPVVKLQVESAAGVSFHELSPGDTTKVAP